MAGENQPRIGSPVAMTTGWPGAVACRSRSAAVMASGRPSSVARAASYSTVIRPRDETSTLMRRSTASPMFLRTRGSGMTPSALGRVRELAFQHRGDVRVGALGHRHVAGELLGRRKVGAVQCAAAEVEQVLVILHEC